MASLRPDIHSHGSQPTSPTLSVQPTAPRPTLVPAVLTNGVRQAFQQILGSRRSGHYPDDAGSLGVGPNGDPRWACERRGRLAPSYEVSHQRSVRPQT